MFHLLILAIIETLYIDIQVFVYLNDGKDLIIYYVSSPYPCNYRNPLYRYSSLCLSQ